MIEALKDDKIVNAVGGRFKFTALIQHRVRELMEGSRPLVERRGRSDFEIAVQEVVEGKIAAADDSDEQVQEQAEAEPPAEQA